MTAISPGDVPHLVFETTCRCPRLEPNGPSLVEQVRAAAAAGFSAITIDEWTLDAEQRAGAADEELAALLHRAGLRSAAVVAVRCSAAEGATSSAQRWLPVVEALRPSVAVTVVEVDPTAQVVADLRRAARIIEDAGARLALEFMPYRPVADLASARSLAAVIGSGTGVCIDAWQFFRTGSPWDELETLGAEEIAYVQLADGPAIGTADVRDEAVRGRRLPGAGEFDLARFVALVRDSGYGGDVGLEVMSATNREQEISAFAADLFDSGPRYSTSLDKPYG